MRTSLVAMLLFLLMYAAGCDATAPTDGSTDLPAPAALEDEGLRAPTLALPPDSVRGGGL